MGIEKTDPKQEEKDIVYTQHLKTASNRTLLFKC